MKIKFKPQYVITPTITNDLMRIEAVKEHIDNLQLNPTVLASLRETVRLHTIYYSTMIDGNRLSYEQVEEVIKQQKGHDPDRSVAIISQK